MSDWGWVTLGYGVVYGVVAAYAAFLVRRVRMARDQVAMSGTTPGDN